MASGRAARPGRRASLLLMAASLAFALFAPACLTACAASSASEGGAAGTAEESTTTAAASGAAVTSSSADADEGDGADEAGADAVDEDEAETETVAEDPVAALAAATLNPDGVPVSEGLPYEGMDEQFIDYTWMGPADGSKLLTTGSSAGSTVYTWYAQNDTGDKVLSATVTDGVVASLTHWNYYSDYWRDVVTLELLDYPDMDATGKRVVPYSGGTASIPTLPDPLDYDDPYEFADDAEEWFEYMGCDDPYDAALRYWDDNGP